MAIPRSTTVTAAIIAILLTGCAQPDPDGEPTYTCTPSAGTPQPCYKAEHDLQIREDKLYVEAEAVYRKFVVEDERIYRAGGIDKPTPALLEVATGDFLASSMIIYRASKKTSTKLVGGTFSTAWLRRAPESATPDSVVTMRDCRDASSATLTSPGEPPSSGGFTSDTLHFVRVDRQLKISSAEGDVVERC